VTAALALKLADPLDVFTARCEARATLVAVGFMDLHTAIDELQADAERDGLVERVGQDEVQRLMSEAFR
jgi:NADH:ubiquinone oxidoreductase subunit B-like Fe-S oxidoreductase